jgi:DNA-binding transcriptional LysR family regulator
MKALDIEAVQAFVLVADLKSFTRAAEALDTTQSAISLKIKRLEDGLGRRLLERTSRLVRLSAEGMTFLEPARSLVAAHQGAVGSFEAERRRLVVGINHHIVGAELPRLLKQVNSSEPGVVMEMRISTSRDLVAAYDRGELDAAVVLRHDNRRDGGEIVMEENFGWMGLPDFEHRAGEPLRLATQPAPCSVRSMAVDALDGAGVAWTEVFVGDGISTVGAAISAGLAIAALGRRVAPMGTVDLGAKLNLPPLPSRDIVLYTNATDRLARNSLRTLAAAIRSTAV